MADDVVLEEVFFLLEKEQTMQTLILPKILPFKDLHIPSVFFLSKASMQSFSLW